MGMGLLMPLSFRVAKLDRDWSRGMGELKKADLFAGGSGLEGGVYPAGVPISGDSLPGAFGAELLVASIVPRNHVHPRKEDRVQRARHGALSLCRHSQGPKEKNSPRQAGGPQPPLGKYKYLLSSALANCRSSLQRVSCFLLSCVRSSRKKMKLQACASPKIGLWYRRGYFAQKYWSNMD